MSILDGTVFDAAARSAHEPSRRGGPARWALLCGLFGVALAMLGLDVNDRLATADGGHVVASASHPASPPSMLRRGEAAFVDPRPFPAASAATLRDPLSFTMQADGVLAATGTIGQGSAARLAGLLDAYPGSVTTVSLNSPGGALDDAIVMGRMLRDRGIATVVEDGALCASSCPLLMAGGATRRAGAGAAIGVHQFHAEAAVVENPAQAVSDTQLTIARITRHLQVMGVDPALWLAALTTPPQSLYYLSPVELAAYRLVTEPSSAARDQGSTAAAAETAGRRRL